MSVFPRLSPRLQTAIATRLGWTSLRPVQDLAGAALLDGHNAVILAPTAGGKTEAAMFPALSLLLDHPPEAVGVLYIAPIKALLNNQAERLGTYTQMVGLDRQVWHGDTTQGERRRFLEEPCELLMTTPESLEVMLASARVPAHRLFADLRMVVIDEVHALAGTDRGAHLMCVLERLARLSKHDVQRVGLSATVGNPDTILTWMQGTSRREGVVVDPPKPPAKRNILILLEQELLDLTSDAAKVARGAKSLFFCQSRAVTEAVAERMRLYGIDVYVHHSSVSFEERQAAEARFQGGTNACITCTSTLELGIDVGDLDKVLQLDAPSTVSAFLQRMGRTGRRVGTVANMTFFCQDPEVVLQAAALVELARQGWVEDVRVSGRCWPVLVHQLLALCLADGAVTPTHAWDLLHVVPDLGRITKAEFDAIVHHMTHEGYLYASDGRVAMGETAERAYGRKNFMELYAVFSSPQLYKVVTANGREVGSLEQAFVDRLMEGESCFLLAGRPWLVEHVNHKERSLRVGAAPRGKKPTWGGPSPMFLDYEVCQAMRDILTSSAELPAVKGQAMELLQAQRDDLGELLKSTGDAVVGDSGDMAWFTFAGGRINMTLKYAIEALTDWKVSPDNLRLRIKGDSVMRGEIDKLRDRLADPATWRDGLEDEIRDRLPEYRLSKFQRALPDWAQREMLGEVMLDVEGARRAAARRAFRAQGGQG